MISLKQSVNSTCRMALAVTMMVSLLLLLLTGRALPEQSDEHPEHFEQGGESMEGSSAVPSVDPVVGSWFCTNNALSYNILFQANGQLVAGEAFLGNTRGNTWIRLGEDRISITGGPSFEIQFDDPDNFSYRELNVGSTGTCKRQ